MAERNYLILFERERFLGAGTSFEDRFKDLRADYNNKYDFKFVGLHEIDNDVFREPADEDEIVERDIILCLLAFDGEPDQLMKQLDDDHADMAAQGFFNILGDCCCGWVEPINITGWRDRTDA